MQGQHAPDNAGKGATQNHGDTYAGEAGDKSKVVDRKVNLPARRQQVRYDNRRQRGSRGLL